MVGLLLFLEVVRLFVVSCVVQPNPIAGIDSGAFREEYSNGRRTRAANLHVQWFFSALNR